MRNQTSFFAAGLTDEAAERLENLADIKIDKISAAKKNGLLFFPQMTRSDSAASVFSRECSGFVEVDDNNESVISSIRAAIDSLNDSPETIFLSLNSRSAFLYNIGDVIGNSLHAKFGLEMDIRHRITTALNEIITNSVIHGNLEIKADCDNSLDKIKHYKEEVEERLADENYLHKRIYVKIKNDPGRITVTVEDQGNGFDFHNTYQRLKNQKHRGINIIASMADRIEYKKEGAMIIAEFLTVKVQRDKQLRERLLGAKLVIIDDDIITASYIRNILQKEGFTSIEIIQDSRRALEKLKTTKPDLIYLDLMMPEINGFEFAGIIRDVMEYKDIGIIVQTMLNKPTDRAKAFHSGASDLINKPINAEELIARTYLHLENQYLLSDMRKHIARYETELNKARELQLSLVPKEVNTTFLEKKYGFRLGVHFQTCFSVGGDLWGFNIIDDSRFSMYIVDFSGHGVTSAFNCFRIHTLMLEYKDMAEDPEGFITHLNTAMKNVLPTGQFATIFYGVMNVKTNRLTYAAGGAPTPMIIGKKTRMLDSSGIPLGVEKNPNYKNRTVPIFPGEQLLLYSDALIETETNHAGLGKDEFLSKDDLAKIIIGGNYKEPQKTVANLVGSLNNKDNIHDDLTITLYSRLF